MRDDSGHFSVSVAQHEDRLHVVALAGELDALSVDDLRPRLAELDRIAGARIVIDLSRLEFIDSSGLNTLVSSARSVEATGGRVVLAGASRHVTRVLELVRVADTVEVVESVDDAMQRARRDVPFGPHTPTG